MPVRISDQQIDIIGTGERALNFYDDDYVLQAQIYLKRDGTLNLPGSGTTATGGSSSVAVHALSSGVHTGILSVSQVPQALLLDGTRDLEGDLAVDADVTIDGVDLGSPGHGIEVSSETYRIAAEAAGDGLQGGAGSPLAVDWGTPTIGTIEPDDSASAGASTNPARSDHQHAIVCAAPGSIQPDDAAAEGSAAAFARSDHTHAIVTAAASTLSVSTSNTEGSATSFARSDHTHAITSSANPGAAASILATNASGGVTVEDLFVPVNGQVGYSGMSFTFAYGADSIDVGGSLNLASGKDITNVSGDLLINPAADLNIDADIEFQGAQSIKTSAGNLTLAPAADVVTDSAIGSDSYVSQTTGWQVSYAGAADFRSIYADELSVQAFTSDVYSALAGGLIITPSRAEITRDFTIPDTSNTATLYVSDHEGAPDTAVFAAGDYVRLRVLDRSGGGLVVTDVYGTVASYSNLPGGEQSWTWTTTTTGYSSSDVIYTGSIALDYGQTGSGSRGVWEVTVLDSAGSPYSQVQTWSSVTDGEPDTFTTHVRIGNLDGISGVGLEYGLWAGQGTADDDPQVIVSDSSASLRNLDLIVHDGSNVVYKVDYATPYYALGNPAPSTYGSGAGVWAGLDSGTYKWRVGDPSGDEISWDGSSVTVAGDGSGVTNINGGNIQTDTITATQIDAGTITATEIAANTITASELAADSVTATEIDVSTLSAISADMATLTAGQIQLGTGTLGTDFSGLAADASGLTYDTVSWSLVGLDDETLQVGIRASDGALLAGGGNVTIDSDGIGLSSAWSDPSRLKWYDGATLVGYLGTNVGGVAETLVTRSIGSSGYATTSAEVQLRGEDNIIYLMIAGSQTAELNATDFRVGALNVGTNIPGGVSSGNAWVTSDVRVGGGLFVGSTGTDPDPGYVVASNGISGWLPFAVHQCLPYAMTTGSNDTEAPFAATVDRAMTVDHWTQLVYVGTTNDGSNYWTITLREADGDVIETLTTASISANTTEGLSATGINHDLDPANAGEEGVYVRIDATGSPGALYLYGPAVYVL